MAWLVQQTELADRTRNITSCRKLLNFSKYQHTVPGELIYFQVWFCCSLFSIMFYITIVICTVFRWIFWSNYSQFLLHKKSQLKGLVSRWTSTYYKLDSKVPRTSHGIHPCKCCNIVNESILNLPEETGKENMLKELFL